MANVLHIIYITGLGDQKPNYQPQIIKQWEKFGVVPHYFAVGWSDGEGFEPKLKRLCGLIDELSGQGRVSLVGVSAGAGAALNAYVERKDKTSGVVFICGKIIGYDSVNPRYFRENPAFDESLALTQRNLEKLTEKDKSKMLSVRPIYDETVPIPATMIPGVESRLIISAFHIPSIFLALTIYKRGFLNFLKSRGGVE